jgi:L-methionine (R)-S-oxide reductase
VDMYLCSMSESLYVDQSLSKDQKYRDLLPQLKALIGNEKNAVANMANLSAALKSAFNFWWVGFYLVDQDELVLGPFQGPVACTRLSKNKGVCAKAWQTATTVIVPDVDQFPGHIACSGETRSEIVVPVKNTNGNVFAVLDVDSNKPDDFDSDDQQYLELIAAMLQTSVQ